MEPPGACFQQTPEGTRIPESQRDSASKPQVVRGISASAADNLGLPVEIFANLNKEVAPNEKKLKKSNVPSVPYSM